MITAKRKFGDVGEDAATEYLQNLGYTLLERNWTSGHHEVDIIMQDGEWLVMVEVKTRKNDTFSDPMRAIDDIKLWNLLEAAKAYRKEHPDTYDLIVRIDAVCIVGEHCEKVEHYIDPFRRRIQDKAPWRAHYRRQRGFHSGFFRSGK